ncbi:MAG: molybdenum cofactor guanylyltransferase [Chitinophagaceae bacterium]|nr:molybdenum cofactor guanylyltransferase [Chitinophagaceae bacterium]
MPEQQQNRINGYILAGGKSARMGTDKGLMMFGGKAVIQHIIEQVQPAVSKLVIVTDNTAYEKFGAEIIPDSIKDIGPAGGIYSALTHSNTQQNFIVSCDMPFVTTAAIEFIVQHQSSSQIILPVHNGHLEPLFGRYSKSCLPQWHALIQQGFLKLHELVTRFDLLKLNMDRNPLLTDTLFENINTPEDFKKALIKRHL